MSEVKPLELLVIDDEPHVLDLWKEFFELSGARVTKASSGNEGIELYNARLADNPYDAVISDLNMSNGSGVDVTRAVKILSPLTQVIVITGREANEEYARLRQELGELKPDAVLTKPIQFDDIQYLVDKIRHVLDMRKRVQSDYTLQPDEYIRPKPSQS
ncbi:response regulator [Candidatus Woesearchaeota archaeon]|nr:response regulator [Candidatus Woesearchaeota archaeon]